MFILITLQYMKDTQMKLMFQRKYLKKYPIAYFKAMENVLNLAESLPRILAAMQLVTK